MSRDHDCGQGFEVGEYSDPPSSKHTPEPWTVWDRGVGWEVHGPDGEPVNDMNFEGDCFTEPNARRIVACVNALTGIEDTAAFVADNQRLRQRVDEREAEVATLRSSADVERVADAILRRLFVYKPDDGTMRAEFDFGLGREMMSPSELRAVILHCLQGESKGEGR